MTDTLKKRNTKQIVGISLFLLIALLGSIWYFYFNDNSNNPDSHAFRAVPQNAPLIVTVKNWKKTQQQFKKIEYASTLSNLGLIHTFIEDINRFRQFVYQSNSLSKSLEKSTLTAALQIKKATEVNFLYLFDQLNAEFQFEICIKDFKDNIIQQHTFSDRTIYEIGVTESSSFFICYDRGLLLMARSSLLIEYGISQLDLSTTIANNRHFKAIKQLTGKNSDITTYWNLQQAPVFLSHFVQDTLKQDLLPLQAMGNWVGIDFNFKANNFVLNGYLSPNSKNKWLQSILKQPLPKPSTIETVLPDHTALALSINLDALPQFYQAQNKNGTNEAKDFETYILPWLGSEASFVITEPTEENFKPNEFLVIKAKDAALATKKLNEFVSAAGELPSSIHQNFTIAQLPTQALMKSFFGSNFTEFTNPFYTILNDEFVIFAHSKEQLKLWIDKFIFSLTLSQDINYQGFVQQQFAAQSHLYFYLNPSSIYQLLAYYSKPQLKKELFEAYQDFQKIKPLGVQLTPYNQLFFINGLALYDEKGKALPNVIWRSTLEARAAISPTLVKKHDTGELDIFIQDTLNNIYLLNKSGEILWTRELDSKIQSEVHQIDYYKNDKLQYLFNTKNNIFLIDRNGKDVATYPRQLFSPATNGLFVVDYDSLRQYRIFIACENNNIYGFEQNGKPLNGWNAQENVGRISFPIRHFMIDNKDHLIALNDSGYLHVFKRNGETRLPSTNLETSDNSIPSDIGFDMSPGYRRVVVTDNKGKTYVANLRGGKFNLSNTVGRNRNVQFAFDDVVGDERKDYILLSEKDLQVSYYDESGDYRKKITQKFAFPQDDVFTVSLKNKDKKHIGTISKAYQYIYLLDENGQPYPDFPLGGDTPFSVSDLFQDGKNILVVAKGDEVYAYKLTF